MSNVIIGRIIGFEGRRIHHLKIARRPKCWITEQYLSHAREDIGVWSMITPESSLCSTVAEAQLNPIGGDAKQDSNNDEEKHQPGQERERKQITHGNFRLL